MTVTKAQQIAREKGMSGLQISYKAQISQPDVSRYLRGERKPFPKHAKRIADALGWDGEPSELFEAVEDAE